MWRTLKENRDALHTQLSLYGNVSSITMPFGQGYYWLFYFNGKFPVCLKRE